MNHLSRGLRIKKLQELLPICPFVDFKDNEYKLLFPYPLVKQYVEFDRSGRIVNFVTGDGISHIDSGSLVNSTVRQELATLGKLAARVNRRINYLHYRYLKKSGKDSLDERDYNGRSREGYDENSIANQKENKVIADLQRRGGIFFMGVK